MPNSLESDVGEPTAAIDVEMAENNGAEAGAAAAVEAPTETADAPAGEGDAATENANGGDEKPEKEKRTTYSSYLSSPIVTLLVGTGDDGIVLRAHQALLTKSPYFERICADFADDGSPRDIDLSDQSVDAVGCFLEYLYTGDYFPRKLAGHAHQLEPDPALPDVDETGDQLLKHARVYTLAGQFALPPLQALASSKIHCVSSTAKGEIAYARYVYACTPADDSAVRAPVAKFWAMRSHTLRAEAEAEFQALCLEHPQFAYDVLTRVLDEKLKREQRAGGGSSTGDRPPSQHGSARKRMRSSMHLS